MPRARPAACAARSPAPSRARCLPIPPSAWATRPVPTARRLHPWRWPRPPRQPPASTWMGLTRAAWSTMGASGTAGRPPPPPGSTGWRSGMIMAPPWPICPWAACGLPAPCASIWPVAARPCASACRTAAAAASRPSGASWPGRPRCRIAGCAPWPWPSPCRPRVRAACVLATIRACVRPCSRTAVSASSTPRPTNC